MTVPRIAAWRIAYIRQNQLGLPLDLKMDDVQWKCRECGEFKSTAVPAIQLQTWPGGEHAAICVACAWKLIDGPSYADLRLWIIKQRLRPT